MTLRNITLYLLLAHWPGFGQAPTAAGFWNTQGNFAGAVPCAECHPKQAARFRENSMSRALEPVEQGTILRGDIHFTFRQGPYSYSISRAGGEIVYKVTRGKDSFETPLSYAFGQGKAGQTYVYSFNGQYFETRVSYYARLKNLDLTVGTMTGIPSDIQTAAGRVMRGDEPRNCFGCHTTGARIGTALQLSSYQAGVQCEACHGPAGAHLAVPAVSNIRTLKNMTPQQANEFCGACHRTREAVVAMGITGMDSARFPAYRLANSACFSMDDPRISCTACHDPHGPLVTEDSYYDAKCNACHDAGKKHCPVSRQNCTSCHMQRVEPAASHHAFADHWIRVVKGKADYPE